MTCPHCEGAQKIFSSRTADRDLRRYKKKGPNKTTRMLFELLPPETFVDATVLDIGGGIGAIQHEAAARGARTVVDVDASAAYLRTAKREAERRGYASRAKFIHGDFAEVAATVPAADVVTLDRVVCCYPNVRALLYQAALKSRRFVGLVYPRNKWWIRGTAAFGNAILWLTRNPFRAYIHPDANVEAPLRNAGFRMLGTKDAGYWQVRVYERPG